MTDPATFALTQLVPVLAEAAMFATIAAPGATRDAVEGILKRRHEAHVALAQGTSSPRMLESEDAWIVALTRAIAPIAPPVWLPMADVLKQKVTLEVGARGLRSFFSSKPSDKEVQRVKRLGALAVRSLRAVLSADGLFDKVERRNIAALIGALGLPEDDAQSLLDEDPISVERLDIYGDLEVDVARAVLSGAWYAAAADGLDPREEQVIRALAVKLHRTPEEVEDARSAANARAETGRLIGLALVEVVRTLLADRAAGSGTDLVPALGRLAAPPRYHEEVLAHQPGQGEIKKRYAGLSATDRGAVLAAAWGAALHEDPPLSRRSALRARFDRIAAELGDEGGRIRASVEGPIDEALATLASGMR
ncbi:TerB family tellurite resistance protein [Pendulispora brunnea]|uniref:TerB family tellurite resistance protein n=1 Tax=Pendulispora brunnea TaxID=2905690 RepID=A0ABZ2K9G2_9BACT